MKTAEYIELIERFKRHCVKTIGHDDFQLVLSEPVAVEMSIAALMGMVRYVKVPSLRGVTSMASKATITISNLLHVHVVLEGRIINIELDAWPSSRIGANTGAMKDVSDYNDRPVLEYK